VSRGKYLSLEEARRNPKLLVRFMKEHPAPTDKKRFERLLDAMCRSVKTPREGDQT
jgi:hypothetical protein